MVGSVMVDAGSDDRTPLRRLVVSAMRRLPHLAVVLAATSAIGATAITTTAAASPLDLSSDHTALTAYHQYVSSLVASVSGAQSIDNTYVGSIQQSCSQVLSPLR